MTMQTRPAAVAGMFYPDNPNELSGDIERYLNQASVSDCHPKALIAPHAGYMYSGLTAAHAYKSLANIADQVSRVILLGPSHRVGFSGMALPQCEYFETPLGKIPLDLKAMKELSNLPQISIRNDAHAQEHSLEVHLPFLQRTLPAFQLVPIVVGECDKESVAEALELLWGGPETLIVISSDLSHYQNYESAQETDRHTGELIEHFSSDLVGEQACGCKPINGLMLAAKQHQLQIRKLDMRNSGDTAGPRDRVVGYAAYALH